MDRIWYNHRTDNRYTWDKSGYGELMNVIAVSEKVRAMIYSPVIGGRAVLGWNFAPPFIKHETEGVVKDMQEIEGYAADELFAMSDKELSSEREVVNYEYSYEDVKKALRIADALISNVEPVAVILDSAGDISGEARAEALLKLTVHMLSERFANSFGFISLINNSSIGQWLEEAEGKFGFKVRLMFKCGNVLKDRNIVQLEVDKQGFTDRKIDSGYLAVFENYFSESGAAAKDVLSVLEAFTSKTEAHAVPKPNEVNFGFYGAAYAYLSDFPKSPKAMEYFISAYSEYGCPAPKNDREWNDVIFKALQSIADKEPKTFATFKLLVDIFTETDEKYKSGVKNILCGYCRAGSLPSETEKEIINFTSHLHGVERTEFILMLAWSCWNGSFTDFSAGGEDRLNELVGLLPSRDVYCKVLSWTGLVYSVLKNTLYRTAVCNKAIMGLVDKLTPSQNLDFVKLLLNNVNGKPAEALREVQGELGELPVAKVFECSPDIYRVILSKFLDFSADGIENWWKKYHVVYEEVKNDGDISKAATAFKLPLTDPERKFKKFEQERLAEEKRIREEQERILREQEAVREQISLEKELSRKLIEDCTVVVTDFAKRAGKGCAEKNSSFEIYTQKGGKEKKRYPKLELICWLILIVPLFALSMVLVSFLFSGLVMASWSVAAFKNFFIDKSMGIICLLGFAFFTGFLLFFFRERKGKVEGKTEDKADDEAKPIWEYILKAALIGLGFVIVIYGITSCMLLI